MTYPDPVALLRDLLAPVMPPRGDEQPVVVSVRPPDLTGRLPLVEVYRIGGGSTAPEDRPLCAVNLLAPPDVRAYGLPLVEALRRRLEAFADVDPVDVPSVRALDDVTVRTGPVEQPFGDRSTARYWSMTVELVTRDVDWWGAP